MSVLEHEHLIEKIPLEDVRNFCFMAHVDHGKSSLSSRLLELTGNLGPEAQRMAWEHVHQTYQGSEEETNRPSNDSNDTIPDSDPVATTGSNNNAATTFQSHASKERIELLDTLAVEQVRVRNRAMN